MPLADRIKIDIQALKDYLKIEYDQEDALLASLVTAAKEQSALYLNNDFTDDGGTVLLPIPFSVNLAIYRMVGAWFDHRTAGIASKSVGGINYVIGEMPTEAIALLQPYRKLAGL